MTLRNFVRYALFTTAFVLAAGCSRTSSLEPWPLSTDPVVFSDNFGANVSWQPFLGSKLDALTLDTTEHNTGTTSIKISVPASGSYAGGAFTTNHTRNLTGYNALSFWAKASRAVSLDVAGLGNDNTGLSKYTAQRATIALTQTWTQYYIVIPNPARLASEGGMFFFAEGPQAGSAFNFWIDDVQFVHLGTITNPRPALTPQTLNGIVGTPLSLSGATKTVFSVSGLDQTVTHMPGYFDYASSDPTVAKVVDGVVQVVGGGTSTITASLAGVAATGAITVTASAPPLTAAPAPTLPAASVLSLFSDSYPSVPVDTWSASWDQADSSTVRIAGNLAERYTNLTYAGIEFTSHPINATAMTAFHLDIWVPAGTTFKVKLVDFGADGAFGGGDDSECELTTGVALPALTTGAWFPLEIPMSAFTTLTARAHLAQLILSGDTKIVYVDNVYFHQ